MQPSLNVGSVQDAFLLAFTNVLSSVVAYIPTLIAAFLIVAAGLLIGGWLGWFVVKLLESVRIGDVFKNSAMETFLQKADIKSTIEQVVGGLVKWLVFLVFFIAATNLLGLTTVSTFLNDILGYIPRVFSAALILTLGVLVASFVEKLVKGSLTQFSPSSGRLVSKITSYIIVIFSILAAFAELNIAERLINSLFIGFVAMLAIGFGLAFGLGAKDMVAKILDEWYTRLKQDLD